MRAVQVIGSGATAKIAGWANDEKGLLLGISDTTATATSFAPDPPTGTQYYNHVPNAAAPTISLGDIGRLDQLHRPLYPTGIIADITLVPTRTPADSDHG